MSTNLHIRNIDHEIARSLKKRAREQRVSLNTFIVNILTSSIHPQHKKFMYTYHDLDSFAGTWTKKDTESFNKAMEDFEKIDEDRFGVATWLQAMHF